MHDLRQQLVSLHRRHQPVSSVSLTAPTPDFQSRFKRRILIANWKKFPASFTDKEVF